MPPLSSVEDFAVILQKCKNDRNPAHGLRLHAYIRATGLEAHASLGNCLVSMLVEVGSMCHAQQVFDMLVCRDECSWNSVIAGYLKNGESQHALNLYQKMQEDHSLYPSGYTFVALVKACTKLKDLERGHEIHEVVAKKGLLETNLFISSALVDMYAKCGSLAKAQEVFDKLLVRDVVLWNALITGYVEHWHGEEALDCFEQMQHEDVYPDMVTFVCILKACSSTGATVKGREIHAAIAKKGFERELLIGNTLVDMYAKCGSLTEAQEVFDKLPIQDVVAWTSLIAGYAEHECGREALQFFEQMQQEGISPDAVTLVFSLKACGSIGATRKGREIHAKFARKGLLQRDVFVGSTLLDMYAKCGCLAEAQEVFNKLSVRDVVLWNALISGYTEHGLGEEALDCFEQMQHEGLCPDPVTLVCSLKACGTIRATVKGQEKHAEIGRKGLERELLVGNTLVDMYAKCGLLAEAQEVFDKLAVRTAVSWTALIAGYVEHEHAEEALNYFERMQHEGISPVAVTFLGSLKACGSIGATVKGREIHAEISRKGLERELLIGNTLVDMYAKCCSLAEAQEVFDKLLVRSVVSWTSLIAGYAQLGESENVFHIFGRMVGEGIKPNFVTFLSVLSVCSHAGLVDKGQMYFEAISNDYGIIPTLEHYTCMIDLLGRAGHIDKALAMIKKMPYHPGILVWHTVLGACQKWGDVELGRHAFEHAVRLDEKDAAAYVCMSNIYADAAMQEEANEVEAMQVEKQAWKGQDMVGGCTARDLRGPLFGWG